MQGLIIFAKFNRLTAFAWVACGLGTNVFSCQTSRDSRRLGSSRLIRFATGQPLGLARSSRFAITSLCGTARKRSILIVFSSVMLSSVMISSLAVAEVYRSVIDQLGVKISVKKSLISACEFAKRFRIYGRDLSPVSIKMLRAARHAVAWMSVCRSVGVSDIRVSMRLRGAGYRRYSSRPEHLSPNYNPHRFRHILLAFSPGKTLALRIVVGIS